MIRSYLWLSILMSMMIFNEGCFNTNSDIVNPGHSSGDVNAPFTEGYIEYPGPSEKWVGPQNFVVHIVTRGTGNAQISILPALFSTSMSDPKGSGLATLNINIGTVREELARLNAAMQEPERVFEGCLYPVRVNLIRSDGILIERQGCRGQLGWPRVVSEIVNHLIEASIP